MYEKKIQQNCVKIFHYPSPIFPWLVKTCFLFCQSVAESEWVDHCSETITTGLNDRQAIDTEIKPSL